MPLAASEVLVPVHLQGCIWGDQSYEFLAGGGSNRGIGHAETLRRDSRGPNITERLIGPAIAMIGWPALGPRRVPGNKQEGSPKLRTQDAQSQAAMGRTAEFEACQGQARSRPAIPVRDQDQSDSGRYARVRRRFLHAGEIDGLGW
jgi:hypothetical protein